MRFVGVEERHASTARFLQVWSSFCCQLDDTFLLLCVIACAGRLPISWAFMKYLVRGRYHGRLGFVCLLPLRVVNAGLSSHSDMMCK